MGNSEEIFSLVLGLSHSRELSRRRMGLEGRYTTLINKIRIGVYPVCRIFLLCGKIGFVGKDNQDQQEPIMGRIEGQNDSRREFPAGLWCANSVKGND